MVESALDSRTGARGRRTLEPGEGRMRLGRALGTAAMALTVGLTAACNGSTEAGTPEPSGTPSTSAAASGTSPSSAPTLDPAHAVDPPGPRIGQIAPADIVA